MYDQNNNQSGYGGGQPPMRQLFDVTSLNLTCSDCGVAIEKLPFQPSEKEDGTYGRIYCRDCNRKRREKFSGGGNNRPRGGYSGGNRGGYDQAA